MKEEKRNYTESYMKNAQIGRALADCSIEEISANLLVVTGSWWLNSDSERTHTSLVFPEPARSESATCSKFHQEATNVCHEARVWKKHLIDPTQ